jgi:hypothetical protein
MTGTKESAPVEKPEPLLGHPASAAEAAQKVDFTTFPLMEGATDQRSRSLAHLTYRVPADVKSAYEFQKKQLTAQKWKELPEGASVTDQYASGTFTRAGFHVSVMVMPPGDAGKVDVTLRNHGNVDLAKLPKPKDTKAVYEGPASAIYTAEAALPATVEECEKLLLADGWTSYGMEGDVRVYKKNAMAVKVWVSVAPAQGNKTSIQYSAQQMSEDVPMMPGAEGFRDLDSSNKFEFTTAQEPAAVEAFYRKAFTDMGWEATMDKTIEINGKDVVIFRNAAKNLVELQMQKGPGNNAKLNVAIWYQTKAQVDEVDKKAKALAEAHVAKMKAELEKPNVSISLPAGAVLISQSKNEIKLTVPFGMAKPAVEEWDKQLHETGWLVANGTTGRWDMKREGQMLSIVYTETVGVPAEITITSTGVGLEVKQ